MKRKRCGLQWGAAKRDAARGCQWLQQELQPKNQKHLRTLAAARRLQQRAGSVDALRKRLVEHFLEEARSASEWVRVACASPSARPPLHRSACEASGCVRDEAAAASPEEPEAEATRLAMGAAKRDAARGFLWLQQELQPKNQKQLRSLAAVRGLQQFGVSVDTLRKRLLEHFLEEARSASEGVRVACPLPS